MIRRAVAGLTAAARDEGTGGAWTRFITSRVRPGLFPWALGLYAILFVAIEFWASPNLNTDDVTEAIRAQRWALGYDAGEPPLYTWLTAILDLVIGPGKLAPLLLRYACLAGCFWFLFGCARRLIQSPVLATLAPFALVLQSSFAWGAHAGITQTALLCCLMPATLLAFLRLTERPERDRYLQFGLCLGLGLLSHYGFGLFALPLLIAGATIPSIRPALFDRRMPMSLGVALLIAAPHALWMATSGIDYGAISAHFAQIAQSDGMLVRVWTGLWSLVLSTFLYLSPFWLVVVLLFGQRLRRAPVELDPGFQLLVLTITIGFAALLGASLFGIAAFREQRMQPVLLFVPLAVLIWLDRLEAIPRQSAMLAGLCLASVVGASAMLIGQGLFEPWFCRNCRLHEPFPALADAVRQRAPAPGTILAMDEYVAGNLLTYFPKSVIRVATHPNDGAGLSRPPGERCALVWDARETDNGLHVAMAEFGRHDFGWLDLPLATAHYLDLPLLRRADRTFRFGIAIPDELDGNCRWRKKPT